MNHYYELLGLTPGASKTDIKAAYRRLCIECHPDTLPPNTPKKARHIVEEHFKQINEAYAYLMEHPSVYEPPQESAQSSQAEAPRSIFDPVRMDAVRRQLEAERKEIEQQYQQTLEDIHHHQHQTLTRHGLKVADLDKMDLPTKISTALGLIVLSLLSLAGVALGGFFMFLGIGWLIFCGLALWGVLLTDTVNSSTYEVICEIKKATAEAKTRASKHRQQRLQDQEVLIRQRVDYFKLLPITILSDSFVEGLSDRDQFFLLLAIKEREDAEQLVRNLQMGAKIAVGIGLVFMISRFFLGFPF
jgi:hypothetical protein